jgi:hypothetical protein
MGSIISSIHYRASTQYRVEDPVSHTEVRPAFSCHGKRTEVGKVTLKINGDEALSDESV